MTAYALQKAIYDDLNPKGRPGAPALDPESLGQAQDPRRAPQEAVPGVLIPEYRFDENGDVVSAPMYIYTIDKGNFRLVEQFKE